MASSAGNAQTLYGATAAPPPTPSTLPSSSHLSTTGAADLLSSLLRRLPPNLSLPTRRQHPTASAATTTLPTLSFSDEGSAGFVANLSSASGLGFLELTDHGIPVELACSAEAESLALFDLPHDRKGSCFQRNWPLGYESGDDGDGFGESFCLDSQCSGSEPGSLPQVASLREFTREMERVGLRVVEWLSGNVGFKNPAKEDPTRLCSFTWVSQATSPQEGLMSGGFYPFAVGLYYQIRPGQKYSLLTDSGRVTVMPESGSILVTIGDLAQVWSNGKLKKVRGRSSPLPCSEINHDSTAAGGTSTTATATTTVTLLISLPLESTVSPLIPLISEIASTDTEREGEATEQEGEEEDSNEKAVFSSFPFEDYAWRVYHERLSFKDPLDRYRI